MTDPAPPQWVDRYLTLLGEPAAEPSLLALTNLIRSQFRTVTFENVTSLLRRAANPQGPVPPLDPDTLLANWEAGRGGGVCYEISAMFHRLIRTLGYDAELVLAQISIPDGHPGPARRRPLPCRRRHRLAHLPTHPAHRHDRVPARRPQLPLPR